MPVPGSTPGTGVTDMYGFYLKLTEILYKGSHRKFNVRSAHSANSCLGPSA